MKVLRPVRLARLLLRVLVLLLVGCAARRAPEPDPEPETQAQHLPALGPPRAAPDGGVLWAPLGDSISIGALAAVRDSQDRRSPAAWRAVVASPRHRAYALRRLAALQSAAGDSAAADSTWAQLAAQSSIWDWQALRAHAEWKLLHGDQAGADSLLEGARPNGWSDEERASWMVLRARLRAALGDSAQAIVLSRHAVRRYPSRSAAGSALALLEILQRARGTGLDWEDERAAAEVERFRGEGRAAVRRLQRALTLQGADRFRLGLALGETLRRLDRYREAIRALDAALRRARDDGERALVLLERARVHRDARRPAPAYRDYGRAARAAPSDELREAAWWESAKEAEDQHDWPRARRDYAAVAELGGLRAEEAALRLGLLWLAGGARDRALAAWRGRSSEPVRFWRAVALRSNDRVQADAILDSLARLPGYGFYRAAARETLGVRGWNGALAAPQCAGARCAGLALARGLLAIGEREDALSIIDRWMARDPRTAGGEAPPRDPEALLEASRLAYAAGADRPGIRYALLASLGTDSLPPERAWGFVPWAYPPGFDSLYAAFPTSPSADTLERALVQAVTWQESKFDAAARSRVNAMGLLQLMPGTARDVARWRRERAPDEQALLDPELNLRYGTTYLTRQLRRFDGTVAAALAAYNAGPGNVPRRWRQWVDRGGEALLAELLPYAETRAYVKRILGVRQAYRELRPVSHGR